MHKYSFYYSCFSKIKPGAPSISKTPKCQEVPQDNMKNKNNEKHDFLSIHLVQLEGIRHCLSPPLSPFYRASKYQPLIEVELGTLSSETNESNNDMEWRGDSSGRRWAICKPKGIIILVPLKTPINLPLISQGPRF